MYIIKLKKRKQDNSHLNRVSGKANAIGCVRLFVRPFVPTLSFEPTIPLTLFFVCLGNWHYVFACMHYSLRCQNGNQDFFSQFLPASAVLAMACVCLLVTSVCVCVYACVCHKSGVPSKRLNVSSFLAWEFPSKSIVLLTIETRRRSSLLTTLTTVDASWLFTTRRSTIML